MYAWVWGCWNGLCVFVLWLAVSAEQQHLKKIKRFDILLLNVFRYVFDCAFLF